jgi:vacuolar-type H+-ATPase subunit E/Vma4
MSDLAAASDALLADAREQADRMLAEADAEARETMARAREEADAIIARGRGEGRTEGRVAASREEAQAHMLARMEVLGARREAYDELRARARVAALALRDDPEYPQLLERLAAAARADLGADAELGVDPADAGGVRARQGSRRVDYTLAALAERCVAALGPEARRLWT